jgi:hypothetical protein
VRVPPRWIIPALFALAGISACGYAILDEQLTINNSQSKISRLLFPICLILLVAESFSMPLPLAPVDNHHTLNPAYHWLAQQSREFVLVELPLHSAPAPEFPEVKRLYASTLGWWRLVNGYSGYTPLHQPDLAQTLAVFPDQPAIDALQELTGLPSPLKSSPLPVLLLIHPGEAPLERSTWETSGRWQAERKPHLYPLGQFEGDYLYQVLPPNPDRFTTPSLATFGAGQTIHLLAIDRPAAFDTLPAAPFMPPFPRLSLFWQTDTPLPADYTVFIHLRAPDGFVRGQADGPPVSGRYLTTAWSPGEIVQDIHPLPFDDFGQIDHLAIGLYNPLTGQRLPAFGPNGQRLAEDALVIPLN